MLTPTTVRHLRPPTSCDGDQRWRVNTSGAPHQKVEDGAFRAAYGIDRGRGFSEWSPVRFVVGQDSRCQEYWSRRCCCCRCDRFDSRLCWCSWLAFLHAASAGVCGPMHGNGSWPSIRISTSHGLGPMSAICLEYRFCGRYLCRFQQWTLHSLSSARPCPLTQLDASP